MRRFRLLFAFVILLAIMAGLPATASAGGKGAVVYRGDDGLWLNFYWDGEATGPRNVLYWSTLPDWGEAVFCEAPELPAYDGMRYRVQEIPSAGMVKVNQNLFGRQYARVLYIDPDTQIPWNDLCEFIRGPVFGNPIAEGIVQLHYNDQVFCNFGAGRNEGIIRVTGEVVDLREEGACEAGVAHLTLLDHWTIRNDVPVSPDCTYGPEDITSIKFTPPRLTCGK